MNLNGTLLKNARDRKGLLQTELAVAIEVSVPTIVRAEKGESISISTGRKLCEILEVNLEDAVVPRSEDEGDAA